MSSLSYGHAPMLVSLALLPPQDLSRMCAALRAQLDPEHAAKTIPHLTMKQPFVCEAEAFEQVVLRIATLCEQQRALQIELRQAGVFDTAAFGSVLHLHAPRTHELDSLHRAILHALADLSGEGPTPESEDRVFYPHLTLGQGFTPAQRGLRCLHSM